MWAALDAFDAYEQAMLEAIKAEQARLAAEQKAGKGE